MKKKIIGMQLSRILNLTACVFLSIGLAGCSSETATSSDYTVGEMQNTASGNEVKENEEQSTETQEADSNIVENEVEKNYLVPTEEDLQALAYEIGQLAPLYNCFFAEMTEQEKEEVLLKNAVEYLFVTSCYMPYGESEHIDSDPNGILNDGNTIDVLSTEDLLWGFQNVFGKKDMTLEQVAELQELGDGLFSRYYCKDGKCYFNYSSENWAYWTDKLQAAYYLEYGSLYIKAGVFVMYQGNQDFYALVKLMEDENGERYWNIQDYSWESLVGEGLDENLMVAIEQPFDDSYEDAYIDFLWKCATEGTVQGVTADSRFSLGYVNDDDIPELFISEGIVHAECVQVFTYLDGDVIHATNIGEFGYGYYEERTGNLYGFAGNNGIGSDHFEHFDGKSIDWKIRFVRTYDEEFIGTELEYYAIDDVATTREQLMAELSKYDTSGYTKVGYDDCYSMDLYTISSRVKKFDGAILDGIQ